MYKAEEQGHLLKVELDFIDPPIWRMIEVPAGTTLRNLHIILQLVMNWGELHLHMFKFGSEIYGHADDDVAPGALDEANATVEQVFSKKGDTGRYIYDFGDDWRHKLTYMGRAETIVDHPRVLDGRRNGPLENCGGPLHYPEFLKAIGDEKHPEHEETLEWLDADFDPEEFEIEEINEVLEDLWKQ